MNSSPDLTEKEKAIIELLKKGLSNREISREIRITEKTVKWHFTNIYKKFGVQSRFQLFVIVARNQQLPDGNSVD